MLWRDHIPSSSVSRCVENIQLISGSLLTAKKSHCEEFLGFRLEFVEIRPIWKDASIPQKFLQTVIDLSCWRPELPVLKVS